MAALDPKKLEQQLASRKLAAVYLLFGADVKRIEAVVDAVEATVDPADRPFAVERMYAGEERATPVDIVAAARSLPMLGDRRIVIVLRAERFLKPKRAGKSPADDDADAAAVDEEEVADLQPLEEYLDDPVKSTTLVFVAAEIDRSRRFTKRLANEATVAEFSLGPADAKAPGAAREVRAAAVALVQEAMAKAERTIEPAAVQLLVQHAGGDVSKLRGDVERLLLYTTGQKRISAEDVGEIISSEVAVEDEWAVVNAIGNGDAGRALREVGRRLDRGDSPHALLGQLRWWVSARLAEGDPSRVKPAVEALLRTDLALKSSGGDERVLMERLVVDLTGRPIARY
jgi:DNA polymerase-3 subunit delta